MLLNLCRESVANLLVTSLELSHSSEILTLNQLTFLVLEDCMTSIKPLAL